MVAADAYRRHCRRNWIKGAGAPALDAVDEVDEQAARVPKPPPLPLAADTCVHRS